MFANPMYGQYPQYPYQGAYPAPNPQQRVGVPERYNNNLLTPEQMRELKSKPQTFNAKISHEDYLRSLCTHKDENRLINICRLETPDEYGNDCYCATCNVQFRLLPENTPIDEIERIKRAAYSVMHSAKMYMSETPEAMKEFYTCSELILKLTDFWKLAVNQFNRSVNSATQQQQQQGYGQPHGLNLLGQVFGPAMGMGGMGAPLYTGGINPGYVNPQPAYAQPTYPQYYQQQPNPNIRYDAFGNPISPTPPTMGAYNTPYQQPQANEPAQPQYPSANPIGYVDNSQDFTMNINGNGTTTQQQTVGMPGPNFDSGTQAVPPMPEIKNPNLVNNPGVGEPKTFPG